MTNTEILTKFTQAIQSEDYLHIKQELFEEFDSYLINFDDVLQWMYEYYKEELFVICGEGCYLKNGEVYLNLLSEDEQEEFERSLNLYPDMKDSQKRNLVYALINRKDWYQLGQTYKKKRENNDISLTQMARTLGTSPSRLKNFEEGKPVLMSSHLQAVYDLALEVQKLRSYDNSDLTIKSIGAIETSRDKYSILLSFDNKSIVLNENEKLATAMELANNFKVPLTVEMENGNKIGLDIAN
ncbi:helix-turn-helix transcriptional regulator [Cytobacillus horneckiae]|uniref:helix-turn-helix domain-containing protein n=1 Tax=Cytobacillus horneckiae TaxID=549687 RepID=UPI0034CD207A